MDERSNFLKTQKDRLRFKVEAEPYRNCKIVVVIVLEILQALVEVK